MITVRDHSGQHEIHLNSVDMFTHVEDAARHLWKSVHEAAIRFGGSAILRTPDDGEWGFLVRWESGPKDWATAYVVMEGADAPGFTAMDDGDGLEVRFVDLD